MTAEVVPESEVDQAEDLRRAVWPERLDPTTKRPTGFAFREREPDISVDVASLALLEETRARFPRSYVAIVGCRHFIHVGHTPLHRPKPDNISHAVVPGHLSRTNARRIALAVSDVHPPRDTG